MSFAGHVFDMISRTRQNRQLLLSRRDRIKKLRSLYKNSLHYQNTATHEKKLSPEALEKIKADIRKQIKQDNFRVLSAYLIAIILILSLTTFVILKII